MARSTHPHYTAAELYERRQGRRARGVYVRSQRLVARAIAESQEV